MPERTAVPAQEAGDAVRATEGSRGPLQAGDPALDVSLDRLLARRVKLKFYEAGMDLSLSPNVAESFRLFQGRVLEEYDRIVEEFDLTVVDARASITEQQRVVRRVVAPMLEAEREPAMAAAEE